MFGIERVVHLGPVDGIDGNAAFERKIDGHCQCSLVRPAGMSYATIFQAAIVSV